MSSGGLPEDSQVQETISAGLAFLECIIYGWISCILCRMASNMCRIFQCVLREQFPKGVSHYKGLAFK